MKELSIEEKAKAYDKALERAKDFENGEVHYVINKGENIMHWIFPELKESEDERIRKSLIHLVHLYGGEFGMVDANTTVEKAIAWLKKQGEKKPAWSKRDEERYNVCLRYFEEIKPDSVYYKDYLWLKALKQRIRP